MGTGFSSSLLAKIRKRLDSLLHHKSPFVKPPQGAAGRRTHWMKPELVAQIAFTDWTRDGILRAPSFQGLRDDKRPLDVIRKNLGGVPRLASVAISKIAASRRSKVNGAAKDTIAGIDLTHGDKLLYPEAGITKRDLALYYEAIGEWILPHLRDRPLALLRCPDGWNQECFYQKHAGANVGMVIERVTVQDSDGPAVYMMANSLGAHVALA